MSSYLYSLITCNICVTHVCRSVFLGNEFQFRHFKVGYKCCYNHEEQ